MDPLSRRGRWWESTPLAPVATAFVTGIVVERYCPTLLFTIVLMAAACGVMRLLTRSWRPTAVALLSIVAGWSIAAWNRPFFNPEYADREVLIEGLVTRVMDGETTNRLLIATPEGNCLLTVSEVTPEIQPGDIVITHACLEEPDTSIEVEGELDYSSFYYINRIVATGYTRRDDVSVTGRSGSLRCRLTAVRERLVNVIVRSDLDAETQEFVSSVLLGCDDMITQERYDTYSTTGIAHILALSGLHVAIIAWILTVVLWPVRALIGKVWHTVLILLLLTGYAAMTGFQPSVTRAVVMASTFTITKLLERKRSSLNAWCLAALIILSFSPRDLFAPGFQLSFMALAAMITVPQLLPLVTTRKQWLRAIISYCYFTIAALAGTGILDIYYFGRFSYINVSSI